MDVELPYGAGQVTVRLPSALAVEVVAPPPEGGASDERAVVEAALDAPVGSARLEERARGATRVTIVVPDATRPARCPVVVAAVLARLARAGVPDDAVTVLVGGGIHAPPSRPSARRSWDPTWRRGCGSPRRTPATRRPTCPRPRAEGAEAPSRVVEAGWSS
jgi:hypothetical protein